MVRVHFSVEGQTEQTFVDDVLRPHLAEFGVYAEKPALIAHAFKKGKVHRGGGMRYGPVKKDIQRRLKQERGADVRFTTMIDLYDLFDDFPGRGDAKAQTNDPIARVRWLEQAWAEDIGDPRFIPYVQVHEFEAFLFVSPTAFQAYYPGGGRAIEALQAIADAAESPEHIDDGDHSAPSKRIIAQIPDYKGAKRVFGPQIAGAIGLTKIREKCRHFHEWLDKLERLDQGTT